MEPGLSRFKQLPPFLRTLRRRMNASNVIAMTCALHESVAWPSHRPTVCQKII